MSLAEPLIPAAITPDCVPLVVLEPQLTSSAVVPLRVMTPVWRKLRSRLLVKLKRRRAGTSSCNAPVAVLVTLIAPMVLMESFRPASQSMMELSTVLIEDIEYDRLRASMFCALRLSCVAWPFSVIEPVPDAPKVFRVSWPSLTVQLKAAAVV